MKTVKTLVILSMFMFSASVFAASAGGIQSADNQAIEDVDSGDCN